MASAEGKYPTEAYLYVLGVPGGPFKIGYSYRPHERALAALRQGREGCYVVCEEEVGVFAAQAAERYAHWLVRDHHLGAEWFNITEEEAIAAVKKAVSPEIIDAYDHRHMIPDVCRKDTLLKGGEAITTKFPKGTRDRLRALLGSEGHSAFIREAIEEKLAASQTPPRSPNPRPKDREGEE